MRNIICNCLRQALLLRDFAKRDDVVIATKFLPRTQQEIEDGMEKEIRAVDNLMDRLDEKELDMHQMLGILNRRYILHKETDTVIRELGITKATYYRRKKALIELAEIYMS